MLVPPRAHVYAVGSVQLFDVATKNASRFAKCLKTLKCQVFLDRWSRHLLPSLCTYSAVEC